MGQNRLLTKYFDCNSLCQVQMRKRVKLIGLQKNLRGYKQHLTVGACSSHPYFCRQQFKNHKCEEHRTNETPQRTHYKDMRDDASCSSGVGDKVPVACCFSSLLKLYWDDLTWYRIVIFLLFHVHVFQHKMLQRARRTDMKIHQVVASSLHELAEMPQCLCYRTCLASAETQIQMVAE